MIRSRACTTPRFNPSPHTHHCPNSDIPLRPAAMSQWDGAHDVDALVSLLGAGWLPLRRRESTHETLDKGDAHSATDTGTQERDFNEIELPRGTASCLSSFSSFSSCTLTLSHLHSPLSHPTLSTCSQPPSLSRLSLSALLPLPSSSSPDSSPLALPSVPSSA